MDNENQQHTVQDLISLAYDQKPIEFNDAFNDLVMDRIAVAVQDKKIEVAQRIYGAQEVEDAQNELDQEEQEQEETEDGESA
jgi:uncharacterized membrane protein